MRDPNGAEPEPTGDPAADPGSPCISLCRIDSRSGCCEGCMRTLDEIAAWGTMSATDRRRVWALLPQRRVQHAPGDQFRDLDEE